MTVADAVLNGLLLSLGAFAALVAGRMLVNFAQGNNLRESATETGRWTSMILGSLFAVGGMGLVEFADILGMAASFAGSHPFAVSNGLTTILGALGLAGLVDISPEQYIGAGIAIVGVVMLITEVND